MSSTRILIADDAPSTRIMLSGTLRIKGYEVVEAATGAAAWAILQSPDAPKLAILDWMMPEMDGLEVVRHVRARPTDQPPYLIMLTANDEKADIIAGLEAGANDYLTKPFATEELWARVEVGQRVVELHEALTAKVTEVQREMAAHKQAQAALQKSEELLSLFVQHSPILAYIKAVTPGESRVLLASDCYRQMLGVPGREMVGKTMAELFPADFAAKITVDDAAVVANGQVLELDEDFKGRHYTSIKFPIIQRDRTLLAGYTIDITERQHTADALRDISERLQLAIRAADIGIWELDLATNTLTLDATTHRFYGIAPEPFRGGTAAWLGMLHPADRQTALHALERAIQGEEDFNAEFRVIWPDGTLHWLKANALIQRDPAGKAQRVIGTNCDITGLKLALQAAETGTRAKSAFLANMSHEIRTPMSGVLGLTELLLATPLNERQRSYAEKIRTSGEALLAILNDILDLSKIEAGKLAFERIPFALDHVLTKVLTIFGEQATEKGLRLATALDPQLPPALLGDPLRLGQVINNLVSNAVKFTTAGAIELTARVRRQTGTEVELELSVQDSGIGMTAAELSQLFTPFSQADISTTRRFGGSGLGLAISRQLVERMGGTLQAESTPGQGSLFTVVLTYPVTTAARLVTATRPQEMPRARFTNVRALVAEDHEINREIIVELLRQAGIEADAASNGLEAVALVRARTYDILLMDIQMPELDGFAATRAIRHLDRPGVDQLPILALSSHAADDDHERSLAAGMNAHLTKPLTPETLDAALRRWLPATTCVAPAATAPGRVPEPDLLAFPAPPGLDVASGLIRLGGNRELYLKLLRDFLAGYADTPARLLQELRAGQGALATGRVHAVRGIAGNLGGTALEAAAAELEKLLRAAGPDVPVASGEQLHLFIDRHEGLLTAIGIVLARHPVPSQPVGCPGTAAELQPLVAQLKIALMTREPLPCRKLLATVQQRQWPPEQETVLRDVHRQVQHYRLTEALALLQTAFPEVPATTEARDHDGYQI